MKFPQILAGFGLLLAAHGAFGQSQTPRTWVFFKDKGADAAKLLSQPQTLLSERSLERRRKMGIALDAYDLPVSEAYRAQLAAAGFKVVGVSRWLNAVTVEGTPDIQALRAACPSVSDVRRVRTISSHRDCVEPSSLWSPLPPPEKTNLTYDYGVAQTQVEQLGVDCIHGRGFTGRGVLLTVCDGGFSNVDQLGAFDSLWAENRVVDYYDFVNNDQGIFDEDSHGEMVLSTIASIDEGNIVGTAPHVSVLLARTENVDVEVHQEEDNWVMAMEWADSIGTDIIHSSLGYSVFDQGQGDYSYSDMNGDVTIITQGADRAASRGILIVNSAGNEGSNPWHYITAPCDGDSVLCVGAVNDIGLIAGFSSVGPSADGRIKPDVVAMGENTGVLYDFGWPGQSSGTSFSGPLIAGLSACLVQAHPARTNMEILYAIRQSADRYSNPDNTYGYGLPDACVADSILTSIDTRRGSAVVPNGFALFPNPAQSFTELVETSGLFEASSIRLFGVNGALVRAWDQGISPKGRMALSLEGLGEGMYVLEVGTPQGAFQHIRLIKTSK